ncbi:U3 snoRNP protein [Thelotrema lepadinum]|nr:U3 snoRNP protein [Thelotrema lepadinum]
MEVARVPSLSFPPDHTITQPNAIDSAPSSEQLIAATLADSPVDFLKSTPALHDAALNLAKHYLDPLASCISGVQHAKLQAARRKRKRGVEGGLNADSVLRLKEIYLQGFTQEQIEEQARRILEASCREIEDALVSVAAGTPASTASPALQNGTRHTKKTVHFQDAGSDHSSEAEIDGLDESNYIEDAEMVDSDMGDDELAAGDELISRDRDINIDDNDELDGGVTIHDEDGLSDVEEDQIEDASTFVKDRNGLNDGFFSIDDFNANSEFLEQQDARGDPNDGRASDEEDVDWDADPLSLPMPKVVATSKKNKAQDDSSDEEDGPTFGNADLNAPWSDDDDDGDGRDGDQELQMDDDTGNDIKYADFFAAPPRALTKSARRRALPKTQPPNEQDLQRTIDAVDRDIFSDDELTNPSDDDPDSHPQNPTETTNLSTHERRQAALAAQIRTLEAEAIAKRQWTLTGEVRALDRPVNSLIEESLDFQRAGKPIPVITADVSSSIEALIKSRILARQFDEVPRRRPGASDDSALSGGTGRRGMLEPLSDSKNPQSLAEMYETEHLRRTDSAFVDKRSAALKAAHDEIKALWGKVSADLDALSSWNYSPKPADVSVTVVSDVPKVEMEDARPSGVGIGIGVGGGGEEGRLAPQEVYKVSRDGVGRKRGDEEGEGEMDGVVVTAGGGVVGRGELTREQKLRRRRREKERGRKRDGVGKDGDRGVARGEEGRGKKDGGGGGGGKRVQGVEQKRLLGELKRGDVKVIGKGGAITDVKGKRVEVGGGGGGGTGREGSGAGRYKL